MTLKEVLRLYHIWRKAMKIRKWLHAIQWANVGVAAAQIVMTLPPPFNANPYVLLAQAILAAALPSLGGISHMVDGTTVIETPKS